MFRIVIRGRNCQKYIGKCIRRLREQTEGWTAIIILDAPKDFSVAVTQKYIEGDDRFTLIVNEKRKGLGANLWRGIKSCGAVKGDVIAIVDADDTVSPKALRIVAKVYKKHPECLLTYGSYIKMSQGRKTRVSNPYPKGTNIRKYRWKASHLKTFKYDLFRHMPKEYLQHKGKWAEAASDVGLMFALIDLAGLNRCYHIAAPIYKWRDNYKSSTNRALQRKWKMIFRKKKALKAVRI